MTNQLQTSSLISFSGSLGSEGRVGFLTPTAIALLLIPPFVDSNSSHIALTNPLGWDVDLKLRICAGSSKSGRPLDLFSPSRFFSALAQHWSDRGCRRSVWPLVQSYARCTNSVIHCPRPAGCWTKKLSDHLFPLSIFRFLYRAVQLIMKLGRFHSFSFSRSKRMYESSCMVHRCAWKWRK